MKKNKKNNDDFIVDDQFDKYFEMFTDVIQNNSQSLFGANILDVFGHLLSTTRPDENDLGRGMRLVNIFDVMPELLEDEHLMKSLGSTSDYCFLFRDGKRVSDLVFRKGGISNGYKKGCYANLIVHYNLIERTVDNDYSSTWGNHCIVDMYGNIVLEEKNFKTPHYNKGVIASMDGFYYNLLTGEVIIHADSIAESEEFLFLEKRYDFDYYGGKDKPCGVYKVSFETGDVEYFK